MHPAQIIMEKFELLSRNLFGDLSVDMDGVLCDDYPKELDFVDSETYQKFLKQVKPLFIPKYKVHCIISGRLEETRELTVEWLKNNNVQYDHLLLLNRKRSDMLKITYEEWYDLCIQHKITQIRCTGTEWYWESDVAQARLIHQEAKIPVLCPHPFFMFANKGQPIL